MTENLKDNLYTKIPLRFNSDGNFKILVLSDIHETLDFNPLTMNALEKVLDHEKPDLLILGGDNCSGSKSMRNDEAMSKYVEMLCEPFEKRGIPWAHVWGNHDHDIRIDEEIHQSFYTKFEHCLSKSAKGVPGQSNFMLPILASNSDEIKFNVWGLDSNNRINEFVEKFYPEDTEYALRANALLQEKMMPIQQQWGFLLIEQVMWYYNSSKELEEHLGKKVDSLMVFHVPPWEIYNIELNRYSCGTVGNINEVYALGTFNSGLFLAALQRRDVRAICSGHAHLNDAAGTYCNILLATDGSIGYSAYGDNERRGARVFEINENDTSKINTRMVYINDIK